MLLEFAAILPKCSICYCNLGKKNIAAKDIKILKTPLPPIDLQNLFAEFVHQVEISKSEMQNSLNELITTHQALMQQYFG